MQEAALGGLATVARRSDTGGVLESSMRPFPIEYPANGAEQILDVEGLVEHAARTEGRPSLA